MREKDDIMKEKITQDILENYEEKFDMDEMFKKAMQYVTTVLEFDEANSEDMLDISEREKLAIDTHMFKVYNAGVKSIFDIRNLSREVENPYEHVLKCKFRDKEIIIGFSDGQFESAGYKVYRRKNCIYDFTFLINVENKKRLHIESGTCFSKKPLYEKSFLDYEKHLEEYDLKHDTKYKEFLSERLSEWKNKTSLNSEKYNLSESQKEFLANICGMYDFPVSIVLKDGILCIQSSFVREMKVRFILCGRL